MTKGEFTMNFKPDCRVGTRLKFQITEPGLYTARVETLNTQSDHEHFSAIDMVAKQAPADTSGPASRASDSIVAGREASLAVSQRLIESIPQ